MKLWRNLLGRSLERESLATLSAPIVAAVLTDCGVSDSVICLTLAVLGSLVWGRSLVKKNGRWMLETEESWVPDIDEGSREDFSWKSSV